MVYTRVPNEHSHFAAHEWRGESDIVISWHHPHSHCLIQEVTLWLNLVKNFITVSFYQKVNHGVGIWSYPGVSANNTLLNSIDEAIPSISPPQDIYLHLWELQWINVNSTGWWLLSKLLLEQFYCFIVGTIDTSVAAINLRDASTCIIRGSNLHCRNPNHVIQMESCLLGLDCRR